MTALGSLAVPKGPCKGPIRPWRLGCLGVCRAGWAHTGEDLPVSGQFLLCCLMPRASSSCQTLDFPLLKRVIQGRALACTDLFSCAHLFLLPRDLGDLGVSKDLGSGLPLLRPGPRPTCQVQLKSQDPGSAPKRGATQPSAADPWLQPATGRARGRLLGPA